MVKYMQGKLEHLLFSMQMIVRIRSIERFSFLYAVVQSDVKCGIEIDLLFTKKKKMVEVF